MRHVPSSIAILVVAGAVIGALDLRATEPQPAAAMIIALAAVLTWRTPALAPLWLVGSAASIPLAYLCAPIAGVVPRDPPTHLWTTAIALVPAAIGVVLASALRRGLPPAR